MIQKRMWLTCLLLASLTLAVSVLAIGAAIAAAQTDTQAPVITQILPSGTINTTSATIEANYYDPSPGSGVDTSSVMIHLDGKMLMNGCTYTDTHASCPASGLAPGSNHKIEVFVSDKAGNTGYATSTFSVASDVDPPVINNIQPSGTIYTASVTISASYYDTGAPSSGIDPSSAMIHVDGKMIMSGCTASDTSISCPKSGLAVGDHKIEVFVSDHAGNAGYATGSFKVADNTPPVIDKINASNKTISSNYHDPEPSSGINTASASVKVDGNPVAGCVASGSPAGSISCPMPGGLTAGLHSVEVSVSDNAGNAGTGQRSFLLVPGTLAVILPK